MQKRLTADIKRVLLRRHLDEFGSLLGTTCEHETRMSPRISTEFIHEAYNAVRAAGASAAR